MLLVLFPLVVTTSMLAVIVSMAILLKFWRLRQRDCDGRKPPRITEIPIVTAGGQVVNSVEELDMHVEFLNGQLEEKQKDLEEDRAKLLTTEENLRKLTDATNEVKKYYLKLKSEIAKADSECNILSCQVKDFKRRQERLREEVNENVKYYTELLSNIDGTSSEGYEVVKKVSTRNSCSRSFVDGMGTLIKGH
ncbi:unnamed protein product [Acanthoscelides obtectus]|uniref:Uncharacterized protein n=1 Tax=Acanthoscelides obtectus TaxID=200917 RepID=A0A9P0PZ78_ACAOB|nr:unnamed protein product [Acanthoscelides obtectus]CAK1675073.1 hypothetical protein AOBTE_LOCUS29884 [Acanthoscelides obtectus]